MTLVIMAAGMGSRFGGLKQIEPVGPNGEFIIDYSIYDAVRCGFDKVVFIIKEENYEVFKETIGKRVEDKIKVEYVFQKNDNVPISIPSERTKPLGTAHAILCCKDVVKENFAVINADDFYGYDSYKQLGEFLKNTTDDFGIVCYKLGATLSSNGSVKRGVCNISNGYLNKIVESKIEYTDGKYDATSLFTDEEVIVNGNTPVSMNMFGFTPRIFDLIESNFKEFLETNDIMTLEYLIPVEVSRYLSKNLVKVKVLVTTSKWYGITYKEDKELLVSEINKLIEKAEYPKNLW